MSSKIEAGAKPRDAAVETLKKHFRVVFNGNGYDPSWKDEASKRGIWRIDSGVEAMAKISDKKNIELFERQKVLNAQECKARELVFYGHYIGVVEMEALSLIDMIVQQIIPAMKGAGIDSSAVSAAAKSVQAGLDGVHHESDSAKQAALARTLRLETMMKAREAVDAAEAITPSNVWPIATYRELLFLDSNQDGNGQTTLLNLPY